MNTFQFLLLIAYITFQTVSFIAYLVARRFTRYGQGESTFYWKVSLVSVFAAAICAGIGVMSN